MSSSHGKKGSFTPSQRLRALAGSCPKNQQEADGPFVPRCVQCDMGSPSVGSPSVGSPLPVLLSPSIPLLHAEDAGAAHTECSLPITPPPPTPQRGIIHRVNGFLISPRFKSIFSALVCLLIKIIASPPHAFPSCFSNLQLPPPPVPQCWMRFPTAGCSWAGAALLPLLTALPPA